MALGAAHQHRACLDSGLPPLRVSVNLWPRQLKHRNPGPTVREIVSECGCDPRYLDLEITESSLLEDPDQAIAQVRDLRALGLQIGRDARNGEWLAMAPGDVPQSRLSTRRPAAKGEEKMNPLDTIVGTIASGVVLAVILTIIIKLIAAA